MFVFTNIIIFLCFLCIEFGSTTSSSLVA